MLPVVAFVAFINIFGGISSPL